MRAADLRPVLLAFVPALASCAFVLDFDSLQPDGSGGQAGKLLTGGTSARGGEGGGNGDVCEGAVGLVLDGIDERLDADRYFRVTATEGVNAFFLSSYGLFAGEPVVTLYRLTAQGGSVEEIGTLSGALLGESSELGAPASAAGLAYQASSGLLHAYVALHTLEGDEARVWHTVFQGSTLEMLGANATLSGGYWQGSAHNYPVAANLEGLVGAAWIKEDQSIGLEGLGLSRVESLSENTAATALSVLGTDGGEPVVLYGTSEGVFVERPGSAPTPVEQCQCAPGTHSSFSTTSTTTPGFWIGGWTKSGPETEEDEAFLTSEAVGLYCGSGGCALQSRECEDTARNNLVRNPATSVVQRPGAPAGLVEVVHARPELIPGEDGESALARLVLTQNAVDFGAEPFQTPPEAQPLGPEIELSAQETSILADFRGPDWPVIAALEAGNYLVSWIEPASEGDTLRIQRYRLCRP